MQAPQRRMVPGSGRAQFWQRLTGWAKRRTQSSQTGCAGQVWHTAHWLGMARERLKSSLRNMASIYWPAFLSPHEHLPPRPRWTLSPHNAGGSKWRWNRPGCIKRWRVAWRTAYSGSCGSRQAGCTGNRCVVASKCMIRWCGAIQMRNARCRKARLRISVGTAQAATTVVDCRTLEGPGH